MVTFPFRMVQARLQKADERIEALQHAVDSLIVFNNNRMSPPDPRFSMCNVFSVSRHAIAETIKCISEMIQEPEIVGIDFADICTIMCKGGVSVLITGESRLSDPPGDLVRSCLDHPVNDIDHRSARACLILFTGSIDMTLMRAEKIACLLSSELQPHADVVWGARIDPGYDDIVWVHALYTNIKKPERSAYSIQIQEEDDHE